ncbi:primosomal protein N' [Beijerinckiaceae bacterium]|nr:primosomal protein N' [Beijerinckiaceae bacterium]
MRESGQAKPGERAVTIAEVLLPVAIDHPYSYLVRPGTTVTPGAFVDVPLGTRITSGVVWEVREAASERPNLKTIAAVLDLPPLPGNLRSFIDWVARWTLSPQGMVLRMAIGAPFHAGPEPVRIGVRLAGPPPRRMTPARARVLAAAEGGLAFPKAVLAEAAACSGGVIDTLIDEGTLEAVALPPDPVAPSCDPGFAQPCLEASQAAAAEHLIARVKAREFSVTLLEGVTGSGKTEVYFEAVAATYEAGRQTLILMPEIALTAQFLDRFAARFGARPAEWHSGVSARKRARLWSAVALGEVKVVVGARSALFLPFADLGALIVDEEHEAAYKQEDGVAYHARDMAVVRGRIEKGAVILASATPSIESRVNAQQGRYGHVQLASRFKARAMPKLAAIDLRSEAAPRGRWIAPRLVAAVSAALAQGEQALLFLNRRGYAPLTVCRSCGHRFHCPNCTAWLVEHRFRRALMCHHCGHIERRPNICPACGAEDSLSACGPGIERLAEETSELFPDARTLVLSSDFPGGTERLRNELDAIARGECDIIIGTQLVAKGHNFPLLSLVGVIDADIGLTSGDPRAAERTFQLLNQVTGRAGRFETAGRALVQTWQPEHPVMRALLSGDFESFYGAETEQRRRAGLPPFGRLAALIISARDSGTAETHARALARAAYTLPPTPGWRLAPAGGLPEENEISLLGPAEAPIAVIRGRHRFRLLVRAPRSADLQGFLRAWLAAGPPEKGGVRVAVDVDPQSFL